METLAPVRTEQEADIWESCRLIAVPGSTAAEGEEVGHCKVVGSRSRH